MNKILKICMLLVIILFGIKIPFIYGAGRFVDIPVPPNSSGYTDFSPEDGEKQEKQYEQQQQKNENIVNNYIEKSSNNYLKNLEIEGFQIEPKFDKKTNNYNLDISNINNISEVNVIAEAEEPEKSKIEGKGIIKITEGQNLININVIAENGNLNVYTINVNNNSEKKAESVNVQNTLNSENVVSEKKNSENDVSKNMLAESNQNNDIFLNKMNDKIFYIIIIIFILFLILLFKNKKHKKSNRKGL